MRFFVFGILHGQATSNSSRHRAVRMPFCGAKNYNRGGRYRCRTVLDTCGELGCVVLCSSPHFSTVVPKFNETIGTLLFISTSQSSTMHSWAVDDCLLSICKFGSYNPCRIIQGALCNQRVGGSSPSASSIPRTMAFRIKLPFRCRGNL